MPISLPRIAATLFTAAFCVVPVAHAQKRKHQEPKSQVLPLPPELPKAVLAETAMLDFHISPPVRTGHLSGQVRLSLGDLIRDTHGETIVKLRAFVAGPGDARTVQSEATSLFSEHRLPLPALSILQVGALSAPGAQVIIEAVVATRKQVNPNGLAFAAGQRGRTFSESLDKFGEAMKEASVPSDGVLSVTCFTAQVSDIPQAQASLRSRFPSAVSNLVQALRDPIDETTTCEGVGRPHPNATDAPPLELLEKSRVAIVTSPQLIFTGLQLSFGNYLDDAEEAVARLQRNASALASVAAPIVVDVFAYDSASGAAIRKRATVPPSTFTVQTVEGLPGADATAGIEAILVPGIKTTPTAAR